MEKSRGFWVSLRGISRWFGREFLIRCRKGSVPKRDESNLFHVEQFLKREAVPEMFHVEHRFLESDRKRVQVREAAHTAIARWLSASGN